MDFNNKIIAEGITFDDILLLPRRSEIVPTEVDTSTQLTPKIRLNIPLLSAPMDTVTESALAISLAQQGGLGFIHKNLTIDQQVREVSKTKRSANGVIQDPITLPPSATAEHAHELMATQHVSGIPITHDGTSTGKVVGILTRRDMMFLNASNMDITVKDVMTKDRLVTAGANTTLEQAAKILNSNKVEKLLLVDDDMMLKGLITIRDIEKLEQFPKASRDCRGRLRVGAAVGVLQLDRVEALVSAGVDVIGVDSAHGHSSNVLKTIEEIKRNFDIEVIGGNIATEQGAADLIKAGADAVKVGIGPGSICTTRVVSGVGVPQITAIQNAIRAAAPAGVSVIADGGIRHSGDISKALGIGANCVMLGSLLAGLDESPGELIIHGGRRFKQYRGMGSQGAMLQGSADRYSQKGVTQKDKLVPEGVEGRVPYRGSLEDFVYQLVGGIRSGMGYTGCSTIDELREEAQFVKISAATVVENHPHDIQITHESPNYYGS